MERWLHTVFLMILNYLNNFHSDSDSGLVFYAICRNENGG